MKTPLLILTGLVSLFAHCLDFGKDHPIPALVGTAVVIELVRRAGETAGCYLTSRYSEFVRYTETHDTILAECARTHLLFPFALYRPDET